MVLKQALLCGLVALVLHVVRRLLQNGCVMSVASADMKWDLVTSCTAIHGIHFCSCRQ